MKERANNSNNIRMITQWEAKAFKATPEKKRHF
jgi:hypothetical protein